MHLLHVEKRPGMEVRVGTVHTFVTSKSLGFDPFFPPSPVQCDAIGASLQLVHQAQSVMEGAVAAPEVKDRSHVQEEAELVKESCTSIVAMTVNVQDFIGQIQFLFCKQVYPVLTRQLARSRKLEEELEMAKKGRDELQEDFQRSQSVEAQLQEEIDKLAFQLALNDSRWKEQEILLQQLSAEKDKLLSDMLKVSTSVQRVEEENMELRERVQKSVDENTELLRGNSELKRMNGQIAQECAVLQQKHAKSARENHDHKKRCSSLIRQYNALIQGRVGRHLPRAMQVSAVRNVPHLTPAEDLMTTYQGKKIGSDDKEAVTTKGAGNPMIYKATRWRSTRAHSRVCIKEPHDDFLDTPREMAALNGCATNQDISHVHREAEQEKELDEGIETDPTPCALERLQGNLPDAEEDNLLMIGQDCAMAKIPGALDGVACSQWRGETVNGHVQDAESPDMAGLPEEKLQGCPRVKQQRLHPDVSPGVYPAAAEERPTSHLKHNSRVPFKFVEPVRKKRLREALPGTECRQCKEFYDAVLGDDPKGLMANRCEHHDAVSRHRYRYAPPATPDGFWNIGFESDM